MDKQAQRSDAPRACDELHGHVSSATHGPTSEESLISKRFAEMEARIYQVEFEFSTYKRNSEAIIASLIEITRNRDGISASLSKKKKSNDLEKIYNAMHAGALPSAASITTLPRLPAQS